MIGTSLAEWIFIRCSIIVLRYNPLIYIALLLALFVQYGSSAKYFILSQILLALLVAEALFFLCIYLPRTRKLKKKAQHPPQMSYEQRQDLFRRCLGSLQDTEAYVRGWFLGADMTDVWRENLRDFFLWGFFELRSEEMDFESESAQAVVQETDAYIDAVQSQLGYKLQSGRGPATSFRLTFDPIHTTYRGLAWYSIVLIVDQLTHLLMWWHGFTFYAREKRQAATIFPPRPQELFGSRQSPAPGLGYWYKPHEDSSQAPVVFFHGIGIGLLTYINFIADLYKATKSNGGKGVGIIAVELLPISFRLMDPPDGKDVFLQQIKTIVNYHEWDQFTIAAHSYGSVLTSFIVRDDELKKRLKSILLVDPVTIMLHLPDVASNFTRRLPQRANEWQLWYFASTDPGVAYCLGRHFFWREKIMWTDELLRIGNSDGRKVSVSLAGKDIIVDGDAVKQYLQSTLDESEGHSGVKVIWYPKLDHAQVFDNRSDYQDLIDQLLQDQRAEE